MGSVRLAELPYRGRMEPSVPYSQQSEGQKASFWLDGGDEEDGVPLLMPLGVQHCHELGRALSRVRKIGMKGARGHKMFHSGLTLPLRQPSELAQKHNIPTVFFIKVFIGSEI